MGGSNDYSDTGFADIEVTEAVWTLRQELTGGLSELLQSRGENAADQVVAAGRQRHRDLDG